MNSLRMPASGPVAQSAEGPDSKISHARIPDGVGGTWEIVKWECHMSQCGRRHDIHDGNMAWTNKDPEVCLNPRCQHRRCPDCYDLDDGDYRLQHCDGAIILNVFDESLAWKWLEYDVAHDGPQPVTWKCPYWRETQCTAVFLRKAHAARHAQMHRPPVVPITCPFPACARKYKQQEDADRHRLLHKYPVSW